MVTALKSIKQMMANLKVPRKTLEDLTAAQDHLQNLKNDLQTVATNFRKKSKAYSVQIEYETKSNNLAALKDDVQ
jgi:DNA-binding ferritin-like protein